MHATRFATANGIAFDLIAKDGAKWNEVACAAWKAAEAGRKDD